MTRMNRKAATMVAMPMMMKISMNVKTTKEMTMMMIMILTKTPIIDKPRSYRKRPFLALQN